MYKEVIVQADVVQLPTELMRMREADRLIQDLIQIKAQLKGEQRMLALVEWSFRVENHASQCGLHVVR